MSIRVTMDDTGALRALDGGEFAVKNLGPAMDTIAGDLLSISDDAFINLADPTTGAAWPELSIATVMEREKLGFSASEVLQRSGILKGSVQTETGPDFASIGASVEYALIHHLGSAPNKGIPARAFVGASPDDLNEFEDIIAAHISRPMS